MQGGGGGMQHGDGSVVEGGSGFRYNSIADNIKKLGKHLTYLLYCAFSDCIMNNK